MRVRDRGERLCARLQLRRARDGLTLVLLDLTDAARGRESGLATRQQEVARVAGAHAHQLTDSTEAIPGDAT